MNIHPSRRSFLTASTGFAAASLASLANPIAAAAQSVGVKSADLPDLTIQEVKVYVADISKIHKLNSPETGEILSVVTNSGIEGNYTIGDRNATPSWLEWAKTALVGKSVIDLLPMLTSTTGMKGPGGLTPPCPGEPSLPALNRTPAAPERTPPSMARRYRAQGSPHAAAARGPTTTRPPPTSACGTSWARLCTVPSTRFSPVARRPKTA